MVPPTSSWGRTLGEELAVDRAPLAAVLVTLFQVDGETRVLLTRRADSLRSHTSQVSFPGGRLEEGELPVDGALREAREEVSLDPRLVTVVGWLHTLSTVAGSSTVVPIVGTLEEPAAGLVANPREVARVFDVSLAELLADGVFHEERWRVPDEIGDQILGRPPVRRGTFPVWFFDVAGDTVWGATARMLMELLCLVTGLDPATSVR